MLDIETAPVPNFLPAQRSGRPRSGDPTARHGVKCASLLTFEEVDGRVVFGSVRLRTFDFEDEAAVLMSVDITLPEVETGAMLVTFNGKGWDMPTLRQRAMANWLFEVGRIQAWNGERDAHRDLMLALSNDGAARWQSLEAACSTLCIPVKDLPDKAKRSRHSVSLGNQCDVVATYLLHLHLRSMEIGSPKLLATGWLALGEALLVGGRVPNHLACYVDHPRIEVARAVMGA